ncbi:choline transporter-like protein 2 isoform X1 [Argiope bruennichi]|uniref:choline transporter-like protein 2 isoform X1 n=1 Tax=Argiope bruennichi TaxID=94029 RepID=UPI002494A668|nr:choline transporter-like protein 2 isoform X1 [Argiope bruennichi]
MKSSETPVTADSSESRKYGEQLTYDPQFKGPVKSRSCTDILCLFLFVSFIAGWGVVAFFAFREGDPKVLVYPTDSAGNICGIGELENKPYLFFFDLLKCAKPSVVFTGCLTPQVCVEKCPNETFYANENLPNAAEIKSKLICKYDVKKEEKDLKTLLNEGHCAKLYLKSSPLRSPKFIEGVPYASKVKDVLLGRCIPELFGIRTDGDVIRNEKNEVVKIGNDELTVEAVKNATNHLAKFLSLTEMGEKVFSDFKTSWEFLLGGLVLSMLVSLIWIVLMRWLAGIMIWLSIILVLSFLVFACYYSTTKYIELKTVPGSDAKFKLTLDLRSYLALRDTWLWFAIISGIVFAILFLIVVFLRKRIFIAIALIKQASKAVGNMPSTLIFPIFPYILMLAFFIFWAAVALYIASSGKASFVVADAPAGSNVKNGSTCNPKNYNSTGGGIKCLFQTYGLKDNLFTSHFYNLFGLFWGLFFTVGVGQVSLAGAFAAYYWTKDKTKEVPMCAIGTGFYRCSRYHLGSIAFGSLLIATVRMIRVMLEYIDQKCKKYDNAFTKAILCCMKCCFWCLENVLKFISKNAYIMIAIYGKNFCSSARRAFKLLMRNIIRVVVLDKITDFLLFMGKLVVVAASAGVSFYFFATDQKIYQGIPPMNYNLLPPIVITIGAYIIASAFFSVYGMAVDTIFLCFLEDCERNDGSMEKPYFMSKELMKILHKKNKFRDLSPPSSPK